MGNNNSNLSKDEKDIYLREIKRLTQQNQSLQGPNYGHTPLNYTDRQKLEMQNKLLLSQMQKQIAQNHAEINRIQTGDANKYTSSYTKLAQQQSNYLQNGSGRGTKNGNNNIFQNPDRLLEIVHNNSNNLSPQERTQIMTYINTLNQKKNKIPSQSNYNQINQNQSNYSNQVYQSNNKPINKPINNMITNVNRQSNMQNNRHNNAISNGNNNFMHQNMGTRDMYGNKDLVKVELNNSLEDLTKSYYTDEEAARIQFEMEEKKRRQEFESKQKTRRVEFNSKLKDFESGPVNAQKLFGLKDGYTLDMLNKAYRKLAIQTHPDRPGGSAENFRTITQSYMLLMEKYKEQEQDRSYYDLKKDADDFYQKQDNNRARMTQLGKMDKERFDVKLFNKIYEENRLYEPNDEGYGNWFQSEENTYEQPKIFSDKFNLNIFNTVFDQIKETQGGNQIQKHNQDPMALMSKSNNINYTTLGGGDIDNFGKPTIKRKDLNFSDLREAYTKTHLINPKAGNFRKNYKSVNELKKDRANISFTPDEAELRRQEMERIKQREEEDRRVRRLKTYDGVVSNHYNKVHQQLLGTNPDLDRQLTYNN